MYLARTQDGMLMGEVPVYTFLKSNRNYVQRIHLCDMAGRDVLNTILSKSELCHYASFTLTQVSC